LKFLGLKEANEAVKTWNSERSVVIIKPDGVARGLVGEIIQRFETKGFKLVALKFVWPQQELIEQHYEALKDCAFFSSLVKYMTSGPVMATIWEGFNVIKCSRNLIGVTDPMNCLPGTIRGDYSMQAGRNIVHGSDSAATANREISLWFPNMEFTF
jgi:nucleoside-diphosphate kinase